MDFSLKLFTVLSLLLFVSMATDMGSPLVVDAQIDVPCAERECNRACNRIGMYGCCRIGVGCTCRPNPACPAVIQVEVSDTRDMVIKKPVA